MSEPYAVTDGLAVYAYPRDYLVTAWPQDEVAEDTRLWSLHVTYRGQGLWTASRGWEPDQFLDRAGTWRWRSEVTRDEISFPLEQALALAAAALPRVVIAGRTAAMIIAEKKEREEKGHEGPG
jgi:hypothetical protein